MAKSGRCHLTGRYYPSLDEHHVVPKEYGGKDGPTIFLGPDVHQTLHRSVGNLTVREEFLAGLPATSKRAAESLIKAIQTAKSLTEGNASDIKQIDGIVVSVDCWNTIVALAADKNMQPKKFISSLLESIRR